MKQIEEILEDEGFIDWASNLNSQQALEWKQWMVGHPEHKSDVDDAVKLLKKMKLNEKDVEESIIQEEKNKLLNALYVPGERTNVISIKKYKWVMTAAACLLLVICGAYLFNLIYGTTKIQTNYGELAERSLPDGSSVILNSNSSIQYAAKWDNNKEREVWIKGEAFFHVTKKVDHKRFVVHTDKFDIVVTGTKFDVENRKNITTVMLKEGGVTIHFPNRDDIKLKPGEYIELNNSQTDLSQVKPLIAKEDKVLAWVNKKLYFENTNILEVCDKIKELYGLQIEINADTAQLKNKTVTGILPNDNLNVLIESLEATSELKMIRNDNKLSISLR